MNADRKIRLILSAWLAVAIGMDIYLLGFSGMPWIDRLGTGILLPMVSFLVAGTGALLVTRRPS